VSGACGRAGGGCKGHLGRGRRRRLRAWRARRAAPPPARQSPTARSRPASAAAPPPPRSPTCRPGPTWPAASPVSATGHPHTQPTEQAASPVQPAQPHATTTTQTQAADRTHRVVAKERVQRAQVLHRQLVQRTAPAPKSSTSAALRSKQQKSAASADKSVRQEAEHGARRGQDLCSAILTTAPAT
jgi:hypothetical protein